jgi:hypothetical protein
MKILDSILSANFEPFITLEQGIRETWLMNDHPEIQKIFYYGNHDKIELIGDKLFVDSPEGLMNVGHKTLKMFDFVSKNFSFDYLYRTNSSSYIDLNRLYEFIINKPRTQFYSAVIGNYNGIKYGSGSGYFLSKDLVDLVLKNKMMWNHEFIDDVSLGKFLTDKDVQIFQAERFDVTPSNIHKIDIDYYHYRVKQEDDRNKDVQMMKLIHKLKENIKVTI